MATRNRQQWPKRFADALAGQDIYEYKFTRPLIEGWLIESLEPMQRTVYFYVCVQHPDEPATAADVAYAYSLKPNHAATILKSLFDLGLLKRERVTDASGSRFVYTVDSR